MNGILQNTPTQNQAMKVLQLEAIASELPIGFKRKIARIFTETATNSEVEVVSALQSQGELPEQLNGLDPTTLRGVVDWVARTTLKESAHEKAVHRHLSNAARIQKKTPASDRKRRNSGIGNRRLRTEKVMQNECLRADGTEWLTAEIGYFIVLLSHPEAWDDVRQRMNHTFLSQQMTEYARKNGWIDDDEEIQPRQTIMLAHRLKEQFEYKPLPKA